MTFFIRLSAPLDQMDLANIFITTKGIIPKNIRTSPEIARTMSFTVTSSMITLNLVPNNQVDKVQWIHSRTQLLQRCSDKN